MKLFNTTKRWANWWAKRDINWKEHYMNPEHPHRVMIAYVLKSLRWGALVEVGCGAGANLAQIMKVNQGKQLGGVDINPDAIAFAKTQFQHAFLNVNSADDIMLSDQATDIILSDMCMIYISPFLIKRHLDEFKRVARSYLVLCELHSPSLWERLVVKWKEGYNIFNWPKLLEENGFYDIQTYKIPKEGWPESNLQQKYGHIIVARVPKNY